MPADQYPLTAESIAILVGLAISAVLSYAPPLRDKWQALHGDAKRLILFALCLTAGIAIMATNCGWALECMRGQWAEVLTVSVSAFIGTQAGYVFGGSK
jgi:hypothetical protein